MPVPLYVQNLRAKVGSDLIMLVGAAAVIRNDRGQVLLHRRSDNGKWSLIGGMVEPGEEPADAVVREAMEEAGIEILPERITGVYGGPDYIVDFPDGKSAIVSIAFACRIISGEPRVNDDESLEVRFFPPDNLPPLAPRHLERIQHALNDDVTFFRPSKDHESV